MLLMYVLCDSFTAQYQSRVFKSGTYNVSQFEMMLAINAWAILFTFAALLVSGEWWITLDFLGRHPSAIWENVGIAVTSATGAPSPHTHSSVDCTHLLPQVNCAYFTQSRISDLLCSPSL